MTKNILVTGGAGFIGSHLCERLVADGNVVTCLDNFSNSKAGNVANIAGLKIIKSDVNDYAEVEDVFKKGDFDSVFHYAATIGVKRTLENPLLVMRDLDGIKNVLECSRNFGVKKIIYASSSEVYGEPVFLPESEDGAINPQMPYAAVKFSGEQFLKAYQDTYGIKGCSLRFFNVYGPRQDSSDYGFVMGIFIKQVLNGECPTVFGDGKQTRDFVYVSDNIEASVRALRMRSVDGGVINVGLGKPVTIFDLAQKICNSCSPGLKPVLVPFPKGRKDIRHRWPDVRKMESLLDFVPKVGLDEGIKKTIDYYKYS